MVTAAHRLYESCKRLVTLRDVMQLAGHLYIQNQNGAKLS